MFLLTFLKPNPYFSKGLSEIKEHKYKIPNQGLKPFADYCFGNNRPNGLIALENTYATFGGAITALKADSVCVYTAIVGRHLQSLQSGAEKLL